MKRLMIVFVAALAAVCAFADGAADDAPVKHGRRKGLPSGGFLKVANDGKIIQVMNDQSLCPSEWVTDFEGIVMKNFGFPVQFVTWDASAPRPDNVAARIAVTAKDGVPALLCAPEEFWAQVNVAALKADNPDEIKFKNRVVKEMWRALGYAMGCGNSNAQPCVMCEVTSLKDLDEAPRTMGPEASGKTDLNGRLRGCKITQFVSYRRACSEGWAPEPTNDVQRAIWEQAKAEKSEKPSNPIKIKPGQKPSK